MFYSEKYNFLYIAAPKTGSTSVETFLSNLDEQGQRFRIDIDGRQIDSSNVRAGSLGHATATDLRVALGEAHYDSLRVFGFVRHPVDKIVSAYYFTRSQSIRKSFELRTAGSKFWLVGRRLIAILAARVMPFQIWCLLYPMKRNSDYYLDSSGRVLVDILGATDRLQGDLVAILGELGTPCIDEPIPHENRSLTGKSQRHVAEAGTLHEWLSKKYSRDIDLHTLARDRYADVDRYRYLSEYFPDRTGLTSSQAVVKRAFDCGMSVVGLVVSGWLIAIAWVLAAIDTRSNGFFMQDRIGYQGETFKAVKIRTMKTSPTHATTVTTRNDPRITALGRFLRESKIDELPQLWNVLIGKMSFVGPRPDVPGFADRLVDDDRIILGVRPGVTGPASLKYRDEETLLSEVEDAERYNAEIIYPDKVRINKNYVRTWSFRKDIRYILDTIFGTGRY